MFQQNSEATGKKTIDGTYRVFVDGKLLTTLCGWDTAVLCASRWLRSGAQLVEVMDWNGAVSWRWDVAWEDSRDEPVPVSEPLQVDPLTPVYWLVFAASGFCLIGGLMWLVYLISR
jgi:hypothetical protein